MSFFSFGQSNRIGVSISDSSIEMIEARVGRDRKIEVLAASAVALESGIVERGRVTDVDRLARALKTAHASGTPSPFSLQTLDIVLPDSVTYFHTFRFPGALSDVEIANALQFQTEEVFPYPTDELVSDFIVSSRSPQETIVQYAVADKDAVAGYAAAASRAGFSVGGLALEAQTLARTLLAAPRKGKASLVADLGEYTSTLFLRDTNGLIATFSTTIAGSALTQAVMAQMDVAREKAETLKRKTGIGDGADKRAQQAMTRALAPLVKHMADIIGWYERMTGQQVDDVALTGGTSLLDGLVEFLTEELGAVYPNARIRTADTFASVQDSPGARALQKDRRGALYAPALGAAVLAAGKEKAFEFFAPSKRVRRQVARPVARTAMPVNREQWREFVQSVPQRTKMILAGVLLLLAGMVLLAAVLWRVQKEAEVTAQIDALQDRTTADEPITWSEQRVTFTFGLDGTGADVPAREIAGNVVRSESIVPADAVATDANAIGTVTLINESATEQALVATTRLLTPEGILFRLSADTIVPAQGSIEADVYADVAGVGGNIGPASFIIPGLPTARQAQVYARSDAPMSGGQILRGTMTQEDIDRAVAAAQAALVADPSAAIVADTGDVLLPGTVQVAVVEAVADAEVGSQADQASVSVRAAVSAVSVSEADMLAYAALVVAQEAGVDSLGMEDAQRLRYTDVQLEAFDPETQSGTASALVTLNE